MTAKVETPPLYLCREGQKSTEFLGGRRGSLMIPQSNFSRCSLARVDQNGLWDFLGILKQASWGHEMGESGVSNG